MFLLTPFALKRRPTLVAVLPEQGLKSGDAFAAARSDGLMSALHKSPNPSISDFREPHCFT